jgi:hypothetical protein
VEQPLLIARFSAGEIPEDSQSLAGARDKEWLSYRYGKGSGACGDVAIRMAAFEEVPQAVANLFERII